MPLVATKVIATLGPTSNTAEAIRGLIAHGVDVVRLNFSHGTLDEHLQTLQAARQGAEQSDRPIAVLGDLCGPKIRLGKIEPRPIEAGDTLTIGREATGDVVDCNYDKLIDEVEVGHRLVIDDGALRFIVTDKTDDTIDCRCTVGGTLKPRKGINLPDTHLSLPSMTEHDRACVKWAIEQEIDYLALSFVRRGEDMQALRELLGGAPIHLVAKIEKPEAIKHADAIIEASDAIMIARGDLGVEMDLADVPIIQKDLIRRCRAAGVPAIVATQMLQSMVDSPTPTRAEVSDVANAIFDGTDAIMLSGETAMGSYPEKAVSAMDHIASEIEAYLKTQAESGEPTMPRVHVREQDAALARGAWQVVHSLDIDAVVVFSRGGTNARIFSKLRLPVPVIALTPEPQTARRMNMYYGILPLLVKIPNRTNQQIRTVNAELVKRKLFRPGQRVLIIGAIAASDEMPHVSNAIMIHEITTPHG